MNQRRPRASLQLLANSLVTACLLIAVVAVPASAQADSVVLPKKGMQYFTVGLNLNPGFLHDDTADAPGQSTTAAAVGTMGQVGVTQIVTRTFYMAAEAQVGLQWFNEHTAAQDADAPSSSNFAWQLGMNMQWLPLGEELGFVTTGGLHLYQAHLDDAPLQVLGGDLRLGKYFWTEEEDYLLVQVGYQAPIIQGLDRPDDFDGTAEWADREWTFHRFTIGFQYGF